MENDVYEDLQSISDQCVKEASGIPASSAAASAAQSEDSMDAQDLLSSKPAQIALLQHQHLKIGGKQLACGFNMDMFTLMSNLEGRKIYF